MYYNVYKNYKIKNSGEMYLGMERILMLLKKII